MKNSRRKFIKDIAGSSAAVALGEWVWGFSTKSYNNIIGANDRINLAVIGANGRGSGMGAIFAIHDWFDLLFKNVFNAMRYHHQLKSEKKHDRADNQFFH